MKKILLALAALSLVFLPVGCESDEGDYDTLATVQVTASEITFQPQGGVGTVTFTSSGPVTVESSRSWCTASVSGSTINVTVDEYDGLENRYADIVIKSGDYSTRVTAHQYGYYFSLDGVKDSYHVEDVNGQVTLPLTHYNHKPAGVADVDWLSAVYEGENVIIKAADNTTGKPRTGNVTIGNTTIEIVQWSFDSVFAGEYDWFGTTTATGSATNSMPVTISDYDAEKGTFRISFADNSIVKGAYLEVPFDPDTYTFTISAGQYVGEGVYKNAPAYIYSVLYGGGYVTWGDSSIKASFTFTLDPETGKFYAPLRDIGTWSASGRVVSGVYFELFSQNNPTTTYRMKVSIFTKVYNNVLIQK